jgi:hypothetical protein
MQRSGLSNRLGNIHPADLLAIILLSAWLAFMWQRVHYGLDLTDEGLYFASTDRLLRGDAPFLDDRENPLRQFNLLNAAVFAPVGPVSLVALRGLGVALFLGQMAASWWVVRRWQGAWIAAGTACLVPALPLYGIWTPGYNEWACACTVVAAAGFARAGAADSVRGAAWRGAIAGGALGVDALVYAPMAVLAAVPLAMIAWGRWRGSWRHPWVVAGAVSVAVAAVVVGGDAAWIIGSGLGPAWSAAAADMVRQQDQAVPLFTRMMVCWGALGDVPRHFLITVAMFAALRWRIARTGPGTAVAWIALAVMAAAVAINLLPAWQAYRQFRGAATGLTWCGDSYWVIAVWYAEIVIGAAGFLVFVAPGALRRAWRGQVGDDAALLPAFAVLALFAAVAALASSLGAINGLHVRAAIAVLGGAAIAASMRAAWVAAAQEGVGGGRQRGAAVAVTGMAALQVVFAAVVAAAGWHLIFKQDPPASCTAAFTRPPLAGIRSAPDQVAALETLRAWVDAHEAASARPIAYYGMPGLAYVLDRRPFADWTWSSSRWSWTSRALSNDFNAALVARMEATGRRADFCVRDCHDAAWPLAFCLDDPLHLFISGHYQAVWRSWPYEVLEPRDPLLPPPGDPPVIADAADLPGDSAHAPGLPDGRVLLPRGTSVARGAGGDVVFTVDTAEPSPIFAVLVVHGADALSLRLRLDSPSSGFYAVLVRDRAFGDISYAGDHSHPGWDVTFPAVAGAGAAIDRGFALVREVPGGAVPPATVSFTFHRLALEVFPPVPGPN